MDAPELDLAQLNAEFSARPPQEILAWSLAAFRPGIVASSSFQTQSVVLLLGNVFGRAPGLRFEAVANRFACLAGIGKPLIVYGSGEHKCPLLHVRDASSAIRLCLAETPPPGRVFNAAAMNLYSNELAAAVQRIRPDVAMRCTSRDAPTQISLEISSQRLLDLGWSPQWSLEAGRGEIIRGLSAVQVRQTVELE